MNSAIPKSAASDAPGLPPEAPVAGGEAATELALGEILIRLATTYINLPLEELDRTMAESLREVGELVRADRAYVIDYDFARGLCRNTYEWCAPGVSAQIHTMQAVDLAVVQEFVVAHLRGQPLAIADLSRHPDATTRALLESQEIRSLLTVPLMLRNACLGCVGFDFVRRLHTSSQTEVRLLQFFGQMLVNFRLRIEAQRALESERRRLAAIIDGTDAGTWEWEPETGRTRISEQARRLLGRPDAPEQLPLEWWAALGSDESLTRAMAAMRQHLGGETAIYEAELRMPLEGRPDRWLLSRGRISAWDDDGRPVLVSGTFLDITDRKRREEALRDEARRRHRESEVFANLAASGHLAEGDVRAFAIDLTQAASAALDIERVGVWLLDQAGRRMENLDTFVAASGEHVSGQVLEEREFRPEFEAFRTSPYVDAEDALTDPRTAGYVERYLRPNGITTMLDARVRVEGRDLGTLCFERTKGPHRWRDDEIDFACRLADQLALVLTYREKRRAEQEREALRNQLAQAQKLESVGRLAGGVAHDFNNMLQAILGNTALALLDLPADSPVREHVDEIQRSAERSANLTRQLLAFARRQAVSPRVLDLNATVDGMLKMLRRLIGEQIELTWRPGPDVGCVRLDPGQLDQMLTNLCVNARDAIDGAGRVTIETARVRINGASDTGGVAGTYACITVSDSGKGMAAEVLEHLFEPFFTTKAVGQGTGLGLAMVHGMVSQNGGFIRVSSEPGRGSVFRLHLPAQVPGSEDTADAVTAAAAPAAESAAHGGGATILMVEDEPSILRVGRRALEGLGYRVLEAASPGEALRQAERDGATVDLLVTDVIMPEMNGRELAERVRRRHPEMGVLYMSGYTADVIARHGVLDPDVDFLEKPFAIRMLADKVRAVLQR